MKINGMMNMFNFQARNNNSPPQWLVSGDLNKDNQIDGKESARMSILDGNQDGKIDKHEHQRELRLFDKNRDGKIDRKETQMQFRVGQNATCDFNADGKVGSLEQNVLNKYDKNNDNLISPLERLNQLKDWDKNQDGRIGPVERLLQLLALKLEGQESQQTQENTKKLNLFA